MQPRRCPRHLYEGKHPGYKYGRKGTAGGSWGRLPSPQSLLVVVVDEFLNVGELFVKVLEVGVRLLTPRICLGPKELLLDLQLHLLQIKREINDLNRWSKKCISTFGGWLRLLAASSFQTSMFKAGRRHGCGNVILNKCFTWEYAAGKPCFGKFYKAPTC